MGLSIGGHDIDAGTVIGSVAGIGLGLVGMQYDANKKAQQAEDDALAAQGAATAAEIARRKKNVTDVRAMYGEGPAGYRPDQLGTRAETFRDRGMRGPASGMPTGGQLANPDDPVKRQQFQQAQVMGAKLAGDVRQIGAAVGELGTQQNLATTGHNMTAANIAAATAGNTTGSAGKMVQQNVMGNYLQGRQQVAGNVGNAKTSALAALANDQAAFEAQASGGQNINPALMGMKQAGSLNAARAGVPNQVIGQMLNMGANMGVQGAQAEALGYPGNNFLGLKAPTSTPGRSGTFEQTR